MDHTDHEHAELLSLFEQATQDIRAFQDRQMIVTNVTILVYAAFVAIAPELPSTRDWAWAPSTRELLPIAAALVAGIATLWLISLQMAVRRARGRLERAAAHFSDAFKVARGPLLNAETQKDWDMVPFLVGAVLMGFIFAAKILGVEW